MSTVIPNDGQPPKRRRRRTSIADMLEKPIVTLIYVCGWSAIIFVTAIFFFVFREGIPIFFHEAETARTIVSSDGPNNDIKVQSVEKSALFNETEVVFEPNKDNKYAFSFDEKKYILSITHPEGIKAKQLVEAFDNDPIGKTFHLYLETEPDGSENNGEGLFEPTESSVFINGGSKAFSGGEFISSVQWRPTSTTDPQHGILALLYGTLIVTIISTLMSVPLGLGAAVYVSEFASLKVKETLKVIIELLAAIPSVVWGFIGVMAISPIIQDLTGAANGLNILNASVVLALMSVPIIVSVGEDSLRAVPDTYREAAQALGANKWEIIYRVLFPAARSGLLAAVLLGVGRAIGETMAVLMCTGHAITYPESFAGTFNLLIPVQTLTATIAAELGEVTQGDEHYRILFLIGIVLFTLTFIVNFLADLAVKGIKGQAND